jgi:hypothetical protein
MVAHNLLTQRQALGDLGVSAIWAISPRISRSRSVSSGNTGGGKAGRKSAKNCISRRAIAGPKIASPLPTPRIAHDLGFERAFE